MRGGSDRIFTAGAVSPPLFPPQFKSPVGDSIIFEKKAHVG
jgi:hypothetical protein